MAETCSYCGNFRGTREETSNHIVNSLCSPDNELVPINPDDEGHPLTGTNLFDWRKNLIFRNFSGETRVPART